MESFLKHYEVVLHTTGPVFVGSGKQLDKKEYILDRQKKEVSVFHLGKMYEGLEKRHLTDKFQQYLLGNEKILGRKMLIEWFRDNRVSETDYEPWLRYKVDCGDFMLQKGTLAIAECVKNANDQPYIPGSSIKGMLRTILLAYCAEKSNNKVLWKTQISGGLDEKKQKRLLSSQKQMIESDVFHLLQRKAVKTENAVNDIMSGFIVSDSDPVSVENLVLCQKIDVFLDGKQNDINILRECIKPEIDIRFQLTIDSGICPFVKDDIMQAIDYFGDQYYNRFLSKFSFSDYPKENEVWLGGGCGFATKTVLHSIFDERQATKITSKILSKKKDSHNAKDVQLGVSPHVLKCTKYAGKMYQFGKCELQLF